MRLTPDWATGLQRDAVTHWFCRNTLSSRGQMSDSSRCSPSRIASRSFWCRSWNAFCDAHRVWRWCQVRAR